MFVNYSDEARSTYQDAEKIPGYVILRSRRRRRISQVADLNKAEILHFVQNDNRRTQNDY